MSTSSAPPPGGISVSSDIDSNAVLNAAFDSSVAGTLLSSRAITAFVEASFSAPKAATSVDVASARPVVPSTNAAVPT